MLDGKREIPVPEGRWHRRCEWWTKPALATCSLPDWKLPASHKDDHFQDSAYDGAPLLSETRIGARRAALRRNMWEGSASGDRRRSRFLLKLPVSHMLMETLCLLNGFELLTRVKHSLFASSIDFLCVVGRYRISSQERVSGEGCEGILKIYGASETEVTSSLTCWSSSRISSGTITSHFSCIN